MQTINLNLQTRLFVLNGQVVGLYNEHNKVVIMMVPFTFKDVEKEIPESFLPDEVTILEGYTDNFSIRCWTNSFGDVEISHLLNKSLHESKS